MITAKFGGTAITPNNLHYISGIITPFHNCVVVSAVGKEYDGDDKTTDLLERYYHSGNEAFWQAIEGKYRRLTEVNCIPVDLDELLFNAKARARKYTLAYCMSLGEELSAKLVAKYLNAAYIEAEEIVRFHSRGLAFKQTIRQMRQAFKGVKLAVTGGYYGMGKFSRQTFSRGGSDVTGALCAVAANSSLYENWTDVYGVLTANPSSVSGVRTISSMSYDEMYRLSVGGAEVLHPDAVAPVERAGIPIKIGNYYNPFGASTLISNCPSRNELLSVAEKSVNGQFVTTVLHNMPLAKITKKFSAFFRDNSVSLHCFDKTLTTCKVNVSCFEVDSAKAVLVTDKSVLRVLYGYLIL